MTTLFWFGLCSVGPIVPYYGYRAVSAFRGGDKAWKFYAGLAAVSLIAVFCFFGVEVPRK